MFSLSIEQTAKDDAQGAEKNPHPCPIFVRRYKTLSASYSVMRLGKKLSFLALGSDILTP